MTTMCPYCHAATDDLAQHYAGDNCLAITNSLGPVTPEGRRLEHERAVAYNSFGLSDAERELRKEQYKAREKLRQKNRYQARRVDRVCETA